MTAPRPGPVLRRRPMAGERRMARLATFRAVPYWGGTLAWIVWFVYPLVPSWLIARSFDELQDAGRLTTGLALLLIAALAAEVFAALLLLVGHRAYMEGYWSAAGLLRTNVVAGQLASGGAAAAPRAIGVGDALARLRDDPGDALLLLDNWVDLLGALLYTGGAAFVLASIDPWAAAVGIIPLVAVGVANMWIGHIAGRLRAVARAATSDVTGLLAATFSAALTVKLGGAQSDVLRRLDARNKRRSAAMVRDQIVTDAQWSGNATMIDVFVGLALLVAARRGLTAGEVTLFASYLFNLVWLPQRIGSLIVGRRRYEVSAGRLDALVAPKTPEGADHLTAHRPLPILGGPPAARPVAGPRTPLRSLDLVGLTVVGRGLDRVDLHVEPGTLTVIAGPVGSGKTSLLRALLGLLPLDAGEVRWNGEVVDDRAAFFVPPQAAYVPQVPRLFAESLADNLRLGYDFDDERLTTAVRLATLEDDVAAFPAGLATAIGTRGVRLSGGQAQRAAAARAFVHRPELLVLDDLASALDVETELLLWQRLKAAGATVIAATNRPGAIARADQVLRLDARS